ncbi:pentapeptide repeat-containing protein [Nonomuraea rubra]
MRQIPSACRPNLTSAHLNDAQLPGARLPAAHLTDAELVGADLTRANRFQNGLHSSSLGRPTTPWDAMRWPAGSTLAEMSRITELRGSRADGLPDLVHVDAAERPPL